MASALYTAFVLFLVGFVVEEVHAKNRWIKAHATFYGVHESPSTFGGACGYDNTIRAGFGTNTAALSSALFRGGEACGACYQLRCDEKRDPQWCKKRATVTITATNFCPPNNHGGWCDSPRHHFDMSLASFLQISRRSTAGVVPIFYTRVPCRRSGGVRFTLKGKTNFDMVMFTNVGGSGDIRAAWVKGSRTRSWVTLHRNWGANWQSGISLSSQKLSFKLMLADRKILEFTNVVPSHWKHGQTFASKNQFV